ncbi:MAG: hypothetical protein AAF891_11355 [Pseudomonadota bacterium]
MSAARTRGTSITQRHLAHLLDRVLFGDRIVFLSVHSAAQRHDFDVAAHLAREMNEGGRGLFEIQGRLRVIKSSKGALIFRHLDQEPWRIQGANYDAVEFDHTAWNFGERSARAGWADMARGTVVQRRGAVRQW